MNDILEFWNEQARTHGTDLAATMPDPLLKCLELAALRRHLDPALDTIEVGCGNGVNLLHLSETFTGRLTGIDFSPDMIAAARQAGSAIDFQVEDIFNLRGQWPQIFTDRCLINIPRFDLQIRAAINLAAALAPGGRLVLIECSAPAHARMNEARARVGLTEIPNHWHNRYIDERKFIDALKADLQHIETDRFSSLYYLISRVFNAKMTPEGESPDYLAEINRIACDLPSVGDFGPHQAWVFRKR